MKAYRSLHFIDYGMVPVISTPLHGFEVPGPPVGSIELDAVDIVSVLSFVSIN